VSDVFFFFDCIDCVDCLDWWWWWSWWFSGVSETFDASNHLVFGSGGGAFTLDASAILSIAIVATGT
jgi:hypothetical protein